MRKFTLLFCGLALLSLKSFSFTPPDEGMWLPMFVDRLNYVDMQKMGLKLTAEEIYSINNSSMKDAIVGLASGSEPDGYFCTGEIVSDQGLLFTNHHCGYDIIQQHSSLEHDYLNDGFWAMSFSEELVNESLSASFLISMDNVTDSIIPFLSDTMSEGDRRSKVREIRDRLEKALSEDGKYNVVVSSFFEGNEYYRFVYQVFEDVRLVGAPPSAIGKFGGDTDNWMWPRHGGDFSLFRIYANKENKPAEYSKENVPYKPKNFLTISLKGYQKEDFTFVFGYPASTREYLTSFGVDMIANKENPIKIMLRQKRLDIINDAMNGSSRIRIQYTSKHQGIANGWKKMIGETKGIQKLNAVASKKEYESRFQKWADSIGSQQSAVGSRQSLNGTESRIISLLQEFKKCYAEYLPVDMASVYLTEAGMAIELVRFAGNFYELDTLSKKREAKDENILKVVEKMKKNAKTFYKDYQKDIDSKIMKEMIAEMMNNMDNDYLPMIFWEIEKKYKNDFSAYADDVYAQSFFADSIKLRIFLDRYKRNDYKKLEKDPAYKLSRSIYSRNEQDVAPYLLIFNGKIDSLQRIYMAGQMAFEKDKRFYPDANSTLRISFGKVDDYKPADGIYYDYYTTSKGILEKEDSTIYDYAIDPKLRNLLITKDFGRYSDKDGTLHVGFIASNHTTGGNSGSPVLDANGYLIGLNFDRNWEGTMSDLMYDPDQCRNITLDIRYCLFIIDKYAGAENLIKEMKIIE